MSQEIELELTFLASFIPEAVRDVVPIYLKDTYIPQESEFAVLRLRKKGDKYEITKKVPIKQGDFSAHVEHTISLIESEYLALEKVSNKIVEKMRYTVKINSFDAEVDIFRGEMDGLVLIDFEFPTVDAKSMFVPPDCCLLDVTQEKTILGGQLAGLSYRDIESWLSVKGYKKLHL